jgi:hypothetical protein
LEVVAGRKIKSGLKWNHFDQFGVYLMRLDCFRDLLQIV